ncbi:MAG: glycosyltransferase family 1 protein [Candidatus Magasanikbacteria bacterium]
MRIGIDARMMSSGFGIGRYIEQLVIHLLELPEAKENDFVLFLMPDGIKQYGYLREKYKNVSFVLADIHWYTFQEQWKFLKRVNNASLDVMHFPHWNVPLFYRKPFVLTVHDLTMFHFPRPDATTLGPIKFWIKDKAHRLILKSATKRAKHIFVTSEFTKQDVFDHLKVPKEKMLVTYQAPFDHIEKSNPQGGVDKLKQWGITLPYVLYVGAAYPHKNLPCLLRAWKRVEEKTGNLYQLVLVGKKTPFYTQLLESEAMKDCNTIIYTDFVEDMNLEVIYNHAKLFVFPSLYEGFGLPPLEAMAHKVPVVSSSASCLPEVLGEGALYFDPESEENMAQVMMSALEDENIRMDILSAGKGVLQNYSWNILAKKTFDEYRKTIE